MARKADPSRSSVWVWWPNFIAGALLPFASLALRSWMPAAVAAGVAFAILFNAAGFVFLRYPPAPSWRFRDWMMGALLGGVACGVITHFLAAGPER